MDGNTNEGWDNGGVIPESVIRCRRLVRLFEGQSRRLQRERKQFAGALHDELQQPLFAVLMRLNSLLKESADDRLSKSLEASCRATKDVIDRMRQLSSEIYPPILQYGELSNILIWLVSELKAERNIAVYYGAGAEIRRVAEPLGYVIYGCVRELLIRLSERNRAKAAWLNAECDDVIVKIDIVIKDAGYPSPEGAREALLSEGARFELQSALEMLDVCGGAMSFEVLPDAGMRIALRFPLQESAQTAPRANAALDR